MRETIQTTSRGPGPAPSAPTTQGGSPVQLRAADYATGAAMLAPVQMKSVSAGPDLAAVQKKLNALGFDCGEADGIWGPRTRQAVVAFQRAKGLTADGIIGSKTLGALDAAAGAPAPHTTEAAPKTSEAAPKTNEAAPKTSEAAPHTTEAAPTTSEAAPKASEAAPHTTEATPTSGGASPDDAQRSEADQLREAIAGSAEGLEGKEFMSQADIDKVRKDAKMPNYTTCIDFAGKTMREGVGATYGKDVKKAQKTAMMLSQIKSTWDKEVGANVQAAAFEKAVAKYDDAIAELQGKKDKVLAEIAELRQPAQDGESELAVKQRHTRADILEKQAIGAYTSAIKQLEGHRAKFQAKVDAKKNEAQELMASNPALIKTQPGMTGGRPKRGEYIMLAQVPGGAQYGVSADTKVHLAGGAFKHIAVYMGHQEVKPGVEEWTTIDGGGTHGKKTVIYVQTATTLVYRTPDIKVAEAGKPWTGTPPGSQLAGWIDTAQLIAMRDAKGA